MSDLAKAKRLVNDLDNRLADFRLDHLNRLVDRNQNQETRVDNSINEHVWGRLHDTSDALSNLKLALSACLRDIDIPF
jgi:hypothetical protein